VLDKEFRMRFGAFFLPQSPDLRPSHAVYHEAIEQMVLA